MSCSSYYTQLIIDATEINTTSRHFMLGAHGRYASDRVLLLCGSSLSPHQLHPHGHQYLPQSVNSILAEAWIIRSDQFAAERIISFISPAASSTFSQKRLARWASRVTTAKYTLSQFYQHWIVIATQKLNHTHL